MVGTIPQKVYGWLYFIKHKNDMHSPAATTSEAIAIYNETHGLYRYIATQAISHACYIPVADLGGL